MRQQIGVAFAACLYYSGLVRLARWYMRHSGPHLIILNYHRASGGDLHRLLLYLRRHYRIMHLEEALDELYAPSHCKKQHTDRRTPMVLTFDDGYQDAYTHAFSLAHRLQIPLTIFLIPGYVENGEYFWWKESERLVRSSRVPYVQVDGNMYSLERQDERTTLAGIIDARLRSASTVAERETFLRAMRQALASWPSSVEEEALLPLTWTQIRTMHSSGWISFGAHTMHHPILANLVDPDEVRYEVAECRNVLEKHLRHPIRTFAYPVGRPEHINEDVKQAVRDAGYTWAVTTVNGVTTPQGDPFALHRLRTDVSRHWLVVAAETSGIWALLSPLWKNKLSERAKG